MLDILAMEEKLTGEYKQAFSKISMYGTMTPIDSDKYDDRVLNIYDMLMTAQADKKPVEKIIGEDIVLFCKEYYKNHSPLEWIGNVAKRIFTVMLIILAYSVVEWLLIAGDNSMTDSGFMDIKIKATPFLIGIVAGAIVIVSESIIKRRMLQKNESLKKGIYVACIILLFAICIALGIVFFVDREIMMPLWVMLAITGGYSLLYIIGTVAVAFKGEGVFKCTDKDEKQALKAYQKELTLEYDIKTSAEAMAERFDKMKNKAKKKGKSEPTFNDFADYIRKDHKIMRVVDAAFTVFSLAIIVVNVVINIDSEGFVVAIIAAIMVAVITLGIFKLAMKALKEVEEAQDIILAECEKNKIDIYEYVERQKNTKNILVIE